MTAFNSGLDGLASSGPNGTRIDETNIAEMVKASETLAEMVRRTRDLLNAAGFSTSGGQVVSVLASDVSDRVVDGVGGSNADRRTAAVSTIVNAQVLLESMANELHVNGSDATNAMRAAIDQVSPATPTTLIDELPVTADMIAKARVGLAAAYAVDPAPAILELHTAVSGIQPGQSAMLVGVILPNDYRSVLQSALSMIAGADDATLDLVNAVARTGGDISAVNLAPSIQGVPASSVVAGSPYSFTAVASDSNGDVLTFDIVNLPSWASFNMSTGELFGTPVVSDVGTYPNIVISVSDGEFSSSLAAFTIIVSANNSAPQISGSAPTSVNVGGNYSFTPTASDPENDTLTFSVSGLPSWASFNTSSGRISGTLQSGDVGTYTNIVISVSDGEFSSSLAAFTITVLANNSAPQISGSAPTSVNVGGNYSFTPTASDPENNTLTFSVSGLPSWASFNTSNGRISGTPQSGDVGTYANIVITVSDGEFSASLAAFTITVSANNSAPQISGTPDTGVNVGGNYSFTPTASDPDNDTLTFSVSGLPSWASFNTSSGRISGTPQSGDVGTSSNIVISVSDGEFSSSLAAFTITVSADNAPPQISGSAATSVNVGDNYTFTPTASDPDNDTLTFSVSGLPSWASFSTSNGRISGTPQSGDVGTSSNIVITVSDGEFSSSLSAFSITVSANNAPPQISGSPDTGVNVGGNYSFTPTASDPENDTLTFSVAGLPSWASFNTSSGRISGTPQSGDVGTSSNIVISVSDGEFSSSLSAFTITVSANNSAPQISGSATTSVNVGDNYAFTPTASDPENDNLTFSVSGLPSWASFSTSNGRISGTPQSGDVGTSSNIVISVSDGEFSSSLSAFTITVSANNSAPQISGSAPTSVNVGDNYAFTPTASDPENDNLTFSVSGLPSWASFSTSNGRISGTPQSGDVGTSSNIVISVSDGEFSSSLSAFTITVSANNSAPQISGSAPTSVNVGDTYAFTPTASDPDNDTLTFSVSGLPSWASFNTSNGRISGTPQSGDVGTYANIVISVSDGEFSSSLSAFTITVSANNSAPQISGSAPTSVNAGENYAFTPTASDPDNDTLTFSVSGLPSWANFNTSTGRVNGTPQSGDVGTYPNIVISVSDGEFSSSLSAFTITVEAVSLGSVTLTWTAPTLNEDGTTLTDLDGYKIYWGTTPGNYPNSVTIDNESVLTHVVDNLAPGTYVFVATSFNTSGEESRYSGMATKVVP